MAEPDDAELNDGLDLDGEEGDGDEGGIDYRFVDPDEDPILSTYKARAQPARSSSASRAMAPAARAGVLPRIAPGSSACCRTSSPAGR